MTFLDVPTLVAAAQTFWALWGLPGGPLQPLHLPWQNLPRKAWVAVPPTPQAQPRPLVVVLHGANGQAPKMHQLTRGELLHLARQQNAVVVFPQGWKRNWNDGRTDATAISDAQQRQLDDTGFLAHLIHHMTTHYQTDPQQVHLIGYSSGGMLALRFAAQQPTPLRSVVVVSGSLPVALIDTPTQRRPNTSLLIIHGDHDRVTPYHGGPMPSVTRRFSLGSLIGAPATCAWWQHHLLTRPSSTQPPPRALTLAKHTPPVTQTDYLPTTTRIRLRLLTLHQSGHTWPQGFYTNYNAMMGTPHPTFNATQAAWHFLFFPQ